MSAVGLPLVCSTEPFFWDIWPATQDSSVNKFGYVVESCPTSPAIQIIHSVRIFVHDMPRHVRVELMNDLVYGGTIQLNYENDATQIWTFRSLGRLT